MTTHKLTIPPESIVSPSTLRSTNDQALTSAREVLSQSNSKGGEGVRIGEAPIFSMLSMGSGSMSTMASRIPVELA
jgi:hypothetical protein